MFRITKIFENGSVEILRVEGKITDEALVEWTQEMRQLTAKNGRKVILDFAQVWFISSRALSALIKLLADHVYVLNCGMEVRNFFHASGLSARMLE